jgi:sugar phosphate permease
MPHSRREITASAEPLPPTSELLRVPSAWGTFLGQFCGNYFFYFLLTWLPIYFVQDRNLSLGAMTRLTSATFMGIACTTITTGCIADRLIGGGMSPTQVRRSIAVGGLLLASSLAAFAFVDSLTGSVVLLMVACLGHGAFAANHWAIGQTLAGPTMAGRWGSIQNGVANLAGIVAPSVAGIILHTRGSLRLAFSLVGAVSLAGALIWYFMVPRVEPVKWKKRVPAAAV